MASKVAVEVCAWALLMLAGGCGKAQGGGGGAQPISEADYASRLAVALCDSLAGCCKSGGFPIDVAGCKAAYTAELEREFTSYHRHSERYDAQAAGDCLAVAPSTFHCETFDDDEAPVCKGVFVGTLAPGEPCNHFSECAPVAGGSVNCDPADSSSTAICGVNPARGEAGDACDTTCFENDRCPPASAPAPQAGSGDVPAPTPLAACYRDDGLYCDLGSCAQLVEAGAPCGADNACEGMLFCNVATGVCSPLHADGDVCEDHNQCPIGGCWDADGDADTPRVCVSAYTPVTAERCEPHFGP